MKAKHQKLRFECWVCKRLYCCHLKSVEVESNSGTIVNIGEKSSQNAENEEDDDREPEATTSTNRGRPIGSTNRKYTVCEERLKTLRSFCLLAGAEPSTFEEAEKSEEKDKWKKAMDEEYDALIKHKTWKLVPRPVDKNIVSVKWIFRIKNDGRYKARLVARGFSQRKNEDYFETYSPVVSIETIRLALSIAATLNYNVCQFDVCTAFLNGTIDDEIYIHD